MEREALLRSREYWLAHIQQDLYAMMEQYLQQNSLKRKDLAEKLGVSKGYVSQILQGNFDHKLSKLVDISLALNKIPLLTYQDLDAYIQQDKIWEPVPGTVTAKPVQYILVLNNAHPVEISGELCKQMEGRLNRRENPGQTKGTTPQNWARLTSYNADIQPNFS